jgi:hypothetical protein
MWRKGGFVGVTPTTARLIAYWTDPDREKKLFFCQNEALQTAVCLTSMQLIAYAMTSVTSDDLPRDHVTAVAQAVQKVQTEPSGYVFKEVPLSSSLTPFA